MKIEEFIEKYGEPFSKILSVNLSSGRNEEIVKWLLASILYSKPIREISATLTYKTFEAYEVLTVDRVLDTGWDGLVQRQLDQFFLSPNTLPTDASLVFACYFVDYIGQFEVEVA